MAGSHTGVIVFLTIPYSDGCKMNLILILAISILAGNEAATLEARLLAQEKLALAINKHMLTFPADSTDLVVLKRRLYHPDCHYV